MTQSPPSDIPVSRRHVLVLGAAAAGGLIAGCGSSERSPVLGGSAAVGPDTVALNSWVGVQPDGRVLVGVPRAEMGQGVHTALAMLVAEELEADWSSIEVVFPGPSRDFSNGAVLQAALPLQPDDEGWIARAARWSLAQTAQALSLNITGGSTSVRNAWQPMRWAGASARAALLATAARQWGVPTSACRAENGRVVHVGGDRSLTFGEAAALWARQPLTPSQDVALKPRSEWRLIGTSPTRLDTPAKTTGRAGFGTDLELPGIQRAVLRTGPTLGAHLLEVDDAAARALPGVRAVHAFPDWPVPAVAVVADTTWQALRGAQALNLKWDGGLGSPLDTESVRASMKALLDDNEGIPFRAPGDARGRLSTAQKIIEADYEVPPLVHAPMETLNATARFQDGRLELWTGTQVPILARWRAAQIADIPIERVTLHLPYLGGGFGRRLETDVVEQVTHLALKMPGVPVQLMWTREQDFRHDRVRPAAMARLRASVDGGTLQALHIRVCAPSPSDGYFRRLFPGLIPDAMPAMPDKSQIEGAFDLPYAIEHQRIEQVLCPTPLPVGFWRGVGHSYNAFFTECFLDEIAQALAQDPLALRLALLAHRPRHRAVLEQAAQRAGWGQPLAAGRARGLALHECFGSLCAEVAEVSLEQGRPRVHRITCVMDAGTIVHPDTARAQIEGGIVFGLSALLWGRVPIEQGEVKLDSWATHPVVRMADMPQVEVHLITSDAPPGGIGEPGTPPVAPAVVNALARLDGQRRRRLPLLDAPRA